VSYKFDMKPLLDMKRYPIGMQTALYPVATAVRGQQVVSGVLASFDQRYDMVKFSDARGCYGTTAQVAKPIGVKQRLRDSDQLGLGTLSPPDRLTRPMLLLVCFVTVSVSSAVVGLFRSCCGSPRRIRATIERMVSAEPIAVAAGPFLGIGAALGAMGSTILYLLCEPRCTVLQIVPVLFLGLLLRIDGMIPSAR
jgi:hypothetical protein